MDKHTHSKQIADRIRAAMDEHGLSGRELARLSGVTGPTVSRILNGSVSPNAYTVNRILVVLGDFNPSAQAPPIKPVKAQSRIKNNAVTKQVAQSLRAKMDAKGITVNELARLTGEDPAIVSRARSGARCPSVATLARFAEVLNVTLDSLVAM